MLLRGHARGDFAQLLKIRDPEYFIDIQVAVMALRGVGIGAEKNQLCAVVADDNRVAGQVDVNQSRKLDDVFPEHVSLRFTGRQKNLVMAGLERAQQCLAGKVERRANLAGFENIANTVRQSCPVPLQLVFERLVEENFFQLCDSLIAEKVLFRPLTLPLLRLATLGLRSASLPVWL